MDVTLCHNDNSICSFLSSLMVNYKSFNRCVCLTISMLIYAHFFFQQSPLATQDQNIMASKQTAKSQFISKLRPPSAIKRPREQALANVEPPSSEV